MQSYSFRRTRHAGHCWRSRDELISDVLQWTPTYGRTKAGRPARTYIQRLCEDTGCSPENLPEAMNNREKWRERVRDIRASGTTWWWWWWWWFLFDNYIFHILIGFQVFLYNTDYLYTSMWFQAIIQSRLTNYNLLQTIMTSTAKSAKAVEYTDCISAEE